MHDIILVTASHSPHDLHENAVNFGLIPVNDSRLNQTGQIKRNVIKHHEQLLKIQCPLAYRHNIAQMNDIWVLQLTKKLEFANRRDRETVGF